MNIHILLKPKQKHFKILLTYFIKISSDSLHNIHNNINGQSFIQDI